MWLCSWLLQDNVIIIIEFYVKKKKVDQVDGISGNAVKEVSYRLDRLNILNEKSWT